ncbi:hypothetical protein [Streptomyces tailanensis]|uniref:hypothetical protein n=1 Tax=Streptomyces tailanensis TaxID=2569858 RepID=UPI001FE7B0A5|nr:hypothetical protein [Streptomyces tailanensis]
MPVPTTPSRMSPLNISTIGSGIFSAWGIRTAKACLHLERPIRPRVPQVARELFAARDAGAGEQQMVILIRGLGHACFPDGGSRAHGLGNAFTDVEFADFSIDQAGHENVGTACRAGCLREGPVDRSKPREHCQWRVAASDT